MLKRADMKDSDKVKVTFVVPHDPNQPRIYVVGDFNNWDPTANQLIKRSNNTRSAAVELDTGKQYKFRYYTEDGEWFNDEAADGYVVNEHGTENCIVTT